MSYSIHWIAVDSLLPLKSGDYLVSDGESIMVTCYNSTTKKWNEIAPDISHSLIPFWSHKDVKFWAYLPKVPK